jgi:hypothetical protein
MSRNDLSPDPCVTAARALAFAEEEQLAGRTVTIAAAVRHVLKHGYPHRGAMPVSFSEGGGANSYSAETIIAAAREVERSDGSISLMEAVRQVAAAVRYGDGGSQTISFAEQADDATRSRLWIEATSLSDANPKLGFLEALKRVAAKAGYVAVNQFKLVKQAAGAASFAERSDAAKAGDEVAYRRAAAQLNRLCPNLTFDECLRCVRS